MTIDEWFAALEGDCRHLIDAWGVGLLDRDASEKLTEDLLFHPVVRLLDALVLNDPNTSDFHLWVRHPAMSGMVLYLAHDGGSRIVYRDLDAFMTAARKASDDGVMLEDVDPEDAVPVSDPAAVRALIASVADVEDREQLDFALEASL